MKPEAEPLRFLVMDACVLIDFMESDPSLFRDIADFIGPVHVVSFVLDEVRQIASDQEAYDLGLQVVDPDEEDLNRALATSGKTSVQDELCCLTAKRNGFSCVTNDRALLRRCRQEGVPALRGLRLLIELFRAGGIEKGHVLAIGAAIGNANPAHFPAEVLDEFRIEINRIER